MAQAFAIDAVALRRWDDCAKDPVATPPDWAHYLRVLESATGARNAAVEVWVRRG